eukprot:1509414-Rhodomonas_salina.1
MPLQPQRPTASRGLFAQHSVPRRHRPLSPPAESPGRQSPQLPSPDLNFSGSAMLRYQMRLNPGAEPSSKSPLPPPSHRE